MTDVSTGMASTVMLASTDPLTNVTTGLRKKSLQCSYVTRGMAYRTTLPVAMVTTAVEFLPAVPVAQETFLLGYLKTRDLELCTTASTQCYGGKGAGRARTSVTRNLT